VIKDDKKFMLILVKIKKLSREIFYFV